MPKKTPTYQELSEQLEALLLQLQQPDVQVDEAVKLYEQGLALTAALEEHLEQAENTIKQLKLQAAGKAG